jgi:hypothetical protein
MPLIKFIGYTGILLLAESVVTAFLGLLVMPAFRLAEKARYDSKVNVLHWTVLGVKCIALWIVATMLVLGAAHYSAGRAGYFWTSIVVGALLLVFFKNDAMLTAQRDAHKATEREFVDPDFALAALKTSPVRRLWKEESIANGAAVLYVFVAAIATPLTDILWLQSTTRGILWLFGIHELLSAALYVVGWLLAAKYLFVICAGLCALPFLASKRTSSENAVDRRE